MEKKMTPPTKRKQLSLQEQTNLIKQHDARRGGDGKVNLSKLVLEHDILDVVNGVEEEESPEEEVEEETVAVPTSG